MINARSLARMLVVLSIMGLFVFWFITTENTKTLANLVPVNTVFMPGLIERLVEVDNIVLENSERQL